jgi:hypothetical protein
MLFAMPVYLAVAAYLSRNGARLSARDLLGIAAFGLVGYYAAGLLDVAALVRICGMKARVAFSRRAFRSSKWRWSPAIETGRCFVDTHISSRSSFMLGRAGWRLEFSARTA